MGSPRVDESVPLLEARLFLTDPVSLDSSGHHGGPESRCVRHPGRFSPGMSWLPTHSPSLPGTEKVPCPDLPALLGQEGSWRVAQGDLIGVTPAQLAEFTPDTALLAGHQQPRARGQAGQRKGPGSGGAPALSPAAHAGMGAVRPGALIFVLPEGAGGTPPDSTALTTTSISFLVYRGLSQTHNL